MRVLHFTKRFSPTSETFIYDYITELERQGVNNHVATLQRSNEESRPFPKVTEVEWPSRWDPQRLWHFGRLLTKRKSLGISKTFSAWTQVRSQLEEIACRVSPDVIHAHFGPAGVIGEGVAEAMKIPFVVTFYGHDISSLPEKVFWREQYAALWPKVDAVTVLSEEMRNAAHQLGCPDDKVTVVHLSRDLDEFSSCPPESQVRRILFVGRLVPKKAPLDAIEAIQQANEQGANLTLDMVGDGPLWEEARRYIEKNDLAGRVTLHGQLPNSKVAKYMQEADAFLLPSKTAPDGDREGTPTVLVEAQAVGLPCVATRHAGIPEMIPEAYHDLLAPEGDVVSLTDILLTLADLSVNDLNQWAKRGQRKVKRDFSLSGEVEKFVSLYSSCQ